MGQEHWRGKWIWGAGEISPRNEWRCFRKEFEVKEPFRQALIKITADSRYVLYVNGNQAGRGPARSWTHEQSYDIHEIGHLLQQGINTIVAHVMHFGVSTFYYVRGRGGLLAQVELLIEGEHDTTIAAATDSTWQTIRYPGHDSTSPRMSCQQAFAEKIDARRMPEQWSAGQWEDLQLEQAMEIGSVGCEPWISLVERDIPLLTEEEIYPVRVESLNSVRTISWTSAVDIRNHFDPASADHANPVRFVGYVALLIRMSNQGELTMGTTNATANFGPCRINGKKLEEDQFYGTMPERYVTLQLQEGDHLILMDVSGGDHGTGLRLAFDANVPFEVLSPIGADPQHYSPYITIGPFDMLTYYDHQPVRALDMEHPDYIRAKQITNRKELLEFAPWIKAVPHTLASLEDVFTLNVWRKESRMVAVPHQLQFAATASAQYAEVPLFEDGDTELILDFGKELSGYIVFDIEAADGTIFDLYGFEYMLDGLRQNTYALDNTVRYICRNGRQTYVSPVRRGLRYLAVTVRSATGPCKIHKITMLQSNYPVTEIGRFQSSNALLNDIWSISRDTARLCMEDTFVDCPAYEQAFWVGDSRNEALISYYLFQSQNIVKRCLKLVPGSAYQTPLYSDQVPSGWSSVIPNWTFFWVQACKEYYEYSLDQAFAEDIWPHISYTLDHYLQLMDERGLLCMAGWNFFDWAPMDQPRDGVVAPQTMFLVQALEAAACLGQHTGDIEKASAYTVCANNLRTAIEAHLWCEDKQAYRDAIHADGRKSDVYSMQTQVAAYLCDIPSKQRKAVIESYLLHPPVDFVQLGTPFVSFFYYEALAKMGQYDLLLQDMLKNYGMMIEYGATSCWEMYPSFAENRLNPTQLTRSHCHAWSAAPGYFIGAYLLGVRNATPGWKSIIVEPKPCNLTWARGSVPLPECGRIDVYWKVDQVSQIMHFQISVPKGIEVEVKAPAPYSVQLNLTEWD